MWVSNGYIMISTLDFRSDNSIMPTGHHILCLLYLSSFKLFDTTTTNNICHISFLFYVTRYLFKRCVLFLVHALKKINYCFI